MHPEDMKSILPIILAAGNSSRMGYPKALLPLGSDLFITRILRTLKDAGWIRPVLVLGKAAPVIQQQIRDWSAEIRINPDPERGQLSSIQLGLSQAGPEHDAAMIWPVDQPAVSGDLVRRLALSFLASGSMIAVPRFGSRRGHPAILHRAIFQEFMDAPMQYGPKGILLRHQGEILEIPTEESAAVQDIDTPAEYQDLSGERLEDALAKIRHPLTP
jgi:molybdenum cofactor cytidylyltransferase